MRSVLALTGLEAVEGASSLRPAGRKINLNDLGLHPRGPIGARFFSIALSENAPSEIAIVINASAEQGEEAGWEGQIHFWMTIGAIRFEEAVTGFLALRVVTLPTGGTPYTAV